MNEDFEHMVDMAMGLSMASLFNQQLSTSVNNALKPMNNAQAAAPAKYIYAIIGGKQQGPFSLGEIMEMVKNGDIVPESYMWKPGMPEWKQASDISDIAPGLDQIPPVIPQNPDK